MPDVKLKQPHTHAGRRYPAGARLRGLRADQVDWLEALGVAEAASPADEPPPEQNSDAPTPRRPPAKNPRVKE